MGSPDEESRVTCMAHLQVAAHRYHVSQLKVTLTFFLWSVDILDSAEVIHISP